MNRRPEGTEPIGANIPRELKLAIAESVDGGELRKQGMVNISAAVEQGLRLLCARFNVHVPPRRPAS